MIHHGNCIEWLRSIPTKSVDHIITDPPYERASHTKGRRVRTTGLKLVSRPISFPPMTRKERWLVSREFARIARRWVIVFAQLEGVPYWRHALERRSMRHALTHRRTCIWTKPDAQPQYSGDRPAVGYECILAEHPRGHSKWNGGGLRGVFDFPCLSQSRTPDDHETAKPIKLMLRLVELFTDPGDLILDPYAGGGTTGVAALRLGRRFAGCELDPHWAARANERLLAEQEGSTIQAREAGQLALMGGGR
jgi:DNA modification methylase